MGMVETHLTDPSSEAETPIVPPCPSSHTRDLMLPSVDSPSGLLPRTSGSASGRPRSNKRIFFSCPPCESGQDTATRSKCEQRSSR